MRAKIYDGTGQPVVFDLWVKPQTNGFHELVLLFSILLQIDRLQLTAVYCNRRACVKTTPQKTRCQNWVDGYSDNNCVDETKYRAKPNNVWSDLKHSGNMWA